MKAEKLSKFELESDNEGNLGHTKNEWGKQEDTSKISIIEAYDLKWNRDKKNDD